MSTLIGHAKAARILGEELCDKGAELAKNGHGPAALILAYMAAAHLDAANRMEQAMREEATGREETT